MGEARNVAYDTFYQLHGSAKPCIDVERFWAKVERGPRCWVWCGSRHPKTGYGQYRGDGAHRIAYALTRGPIPAGQWVLHACDNPRCVNPAHLFLGTQRENMADAAAKGRLHVSRPRNQRVSAEVVSQIKALRASGQTLQAIARRFFVSKTFVSLLVRGKRRQYDAARAVR